MSWICAGAGFSLAQEETGFDYPLGPIGGKFRLWTGGNFVRVTQVTTGAPGEAAGLLTDDFIRGAFGREFDPLGNNFEGVVRQLGAAIDSAEATDGNLPLMVLRPGVGDVTVNVALPVAGGFDPLHPLTSGKFAAAYERACDALHQRIMADSDGDIGYPTGFAGLALLGHPSWNQSSGAKPYRQSLNKLRDYFITRVEGAVYSPVEDLLLDHELNGTGTPSANPHFVDNPVGLEAWSLGQAVMFLAEYYSKSGDATVFSSLQRGAELMANRVQWWKQPPQHENGYSPGWESRRGMTSHGGVVGDYIHGGWGGGINMAGVHLFCGLGLAKRAGVDMSVRPRDGHYFGYDLHPGDTIPAEIATALPASIDLPRGCEDPDSGATTINDPFWYDMTLDQKFWLKWDFLTRSSGSDGHVNYAVGTGATSDAGGRTPAALFGLLSYLGSDPLSAEDQAQIDAKMRYVTLQHDRHLNAHAYNMGGSMFMALALPYLDDRSQRFFLENWKFFHTFSREPDGSLSYFRGRNYGDAYQDYSLVALVYMALPRSVALGGLPHVPGYDTQRINARFHLPMLEWSALEARSLDLTSSTQALAVDVLDGVGNVVDPAQVTATWSVVSGPVVADVFSDAAALTTTAAFPQSGTYRIELQATANGLTVVEPIDVNVVLDVIPPDPEPEPAIITQPTDQSVALGGNAEFSIATAGPQPALYQWFLNGVGYWPPSADPVLTITNVGAGYVGSYQCVYTSGDRVLTSDAASLSISDPEFGTIVSGGLWQETYNGIGGGAVSDLTDSATFPFFSDASTAIGSAETGSLGDSYGQRWSGWIVPKESADYRFYVTSDDANELWLSLDEFEGHKQLISSRSGYRSPRAWQTVTPSAWQSLEAGKRYYFELLHKESGGGDHAAAAWQKFGDPAPVNDSPPIPGEFLEYRIGGVYRDEPASPPVAVDDRVVSFNGAVVTVNVTSNDIDDAAPELVIDSITQPARGTATYAGSSVRYTPAPGDTGSVTFTYTVRNVNGLLATGNLTVTISLASQDLVAWWRFDETNGVVASDSSVSELHATTSGGTLPGELGNVRGAYFFDGIDDAGATDITSQPGTSGFTIAAWIKPADLDGWQGIVAKDSSFAFKLSGTSLVLTTPGIKDHTVAAGLVVDEWQFVVVTFEPSVAQGCRFYRNGVPAGAVNASALSGNDNPLRIANNQWGGQEFHGWLDEVQIYDRVLQPEEVAALESEASPYMNWRRAHFSSSELLLPHVSGDDADTDGDRLPVLVEYVLDLDPAVADLAPLGHLVEIGENAGEWFIEFDHHASRHDVDLALEWSETLAPGDWKPLARSIAGASVEVFDGAQILDRAGVEPETVQLGIRLDVTRAFLRWTATRR
ncbi:MAG: DUF6288 domain-containing protein [Verrucomicrobiales bacterium]